MLSEHFTLEELIASQVALRRGIDNTPTAAVVANLRRLANLLEQIRELVGRPLHISSGYRCPALNRAVGGASNSAHMTGLAADITASPLSPKQLAATIIASGIEFDQLIYEGSWIHIGLSRGIPRKQVLTAHFTAGHASYSEGME